MEELGGLNKEVLDQFSIVKNAESAATKVIAGFFSFLIFLTSHSSVTWYIRSPFVSMVMH